MPDVTAQNYDRKFLSENGATAAAISNGNHQPSHILPVTATRANVMAIPALFHASAEKSSP